MPLFTLAVTFAGAASGPAAFAKAPPSSMAEASAVAQLQDAIDGVDPVFAQYVVQPIASVFFYDVAFWDNGRSLVGDTEFGAPGLVSAGADGQLIIWSEGKEQQRFKLGEGPIVAMALPSDHPQHVVVGWASGKIGLVNLVTGQIAGTYPGLNSAPTALSFAGTGQTLVAGTQTGQLWVWPDVGQSAISLYEDAGAEITALSTAHEDIAWVSADGEKSRLFRAKLYGTTTSSVAELSGHRRGVSSLTFGDGGRLISGGNDGRVLLHSPGSTQPDEVLSLSNEPVTGILEMASNTLIVGRPAGVQIVQNRKNDWFESKLLKTQVRNLSIDQAKQTLSVGRDQGQVLIYDVNSGQLKHVLEGHNTEVTLPFIVVWFVLGAIFFTLRFSFINLRAFGHAIAVTRGAYDSETEDGDVSHFQALAMALSATVGLGNIAGVAVAVGSGGPGAVFWMIVAGFLGMSSKFAECTLGQMYRTTDSNGKVSGGPMHYLRSGLSEMGMGGLGRILSILFAILCIGGSLGGGNMLQANQAYAQVASVLPMFTGEIGSLVFGLLLSGLVGIVIIGGIDRIGQVASYIVPFMVGIYLLAALFILVANISAVPDAFAQIISSAFTPGAMYGGALGVMVTGFRRAAFSNEAGVGSAAIVHSAAATKEPVREGIVALLEPFIDTIVVCTTTALVIVITGAYQTEADGVVMTSKAFETVLPWFPNVLTLAVFLFAFSTMISWSYYGERCWCFLFGDQTRLAYKIIFVSAIVVGSVMRLGSVLDFSDLMILAMSFPNMLGVFLLSGKVRSHLNDYMERLRSGAMKPTAKSI